MHTAAALVCVPLLGVSVAAILGIFRKHGDKPLFPTFCLASVSLVLWQISCIGDLLATGTPLFQLAHTMTVPFSGYMSLGFLLMVVRFYGLGDYISNRLVLFALVLPTITFLLAVTGDPYQLLFTGTEMFSYQPVYNVLRTFGPWYWAHALYCCLMLGLSLYFAISQHLRLPSSLRECSALMIASLLVVSATVFIAHFLERDLWLIMIVAGTCCAMVPLYVALKDNSRMSFLYMARTHVMDQLETSIFLLDSDNHILDANRAARRSLEKWTGKVDTTSLDDIFRQMKNGGAKFEPAIEDEKGFDITIANKTANQIVNVREDEIKDKKGSVLGRAVVCNDVTHNRRLIRWLEQTSGTDPLTGLPNRSSLGLKRGEYESKGALPLSVIAGDLNGLKEVNDTHGHFYGDQLLVSVAKALADCIPPRGTVFRVGGDEFVIVLPNTGHDETGTILECIRQGIAEIEIFSFTPSISLGFATRTSQAVSLDELIHEADQKMYREKRSAKVKQVRQL